MKEPAVVLFRHKGVGKYHPRHECLYCDRPGCSFPSLYSTIVRSTPFLLQLSDVEVRRQKDSTAMPLARYLKEHQKKPWWKAVTSTPLRLIGWCISLFREKPEMNHIGKKEESALLQLTREEAAIVRTIASRVKIEIDRKKRVISITATMQDPLVAAIVADTVQARLKAYMTEYRTNKSRKILQYNENYVKRRRPNIARHRIDMPVLRTLTETWRN